VCGQTSDPFSSGTGALGFRAAFCFAPNHRNSFAQAALAACLVVSVGFHAYRLGIRAQGAASPTLVFPDERLQKLAAESKSRTNCLRPSRKLAQLQGWAGSTLCANPKAIGVEPDRDYKAGRKCGLRKGIGDDSAQKQKAARNPEGARPARERVAGLTAHVQAVYSEMLPRPSFRAPASRCKQRQSWEFLLPPECGIRVRPHGTPRNGPNAIQLGPLKDVRVPEMARALSSLNLSWISRPWWPSSIAYFP